MIYLRIIAIGIITKFPIQEKLVKFWKKEHDITRISLIHQVLKKIDFKELRDDFIGMVSEVKEDLNKKFQALLSQYKPLIQNSKLLEVEKKFKTDYVNFLMFIENFMRKYNKENRPMKRYDSLMSFQNEIEGISLKLMDSIDTYSE